MINLAGRDIEVSDKLLHAGAYFLLALLWNCYFAIGFQKTAFLRRIVVICSACCAFGIFIEVLQGMWTTYRNLDFYDMMANSLG
ncbi:MAG TPA: VanZ family protein, partial [Salinimicrobium sp.]|nr:VanZ family protein [Salinimicrobium sp.]